MHNQEYYKHPAVRKRITEFLGGDSLQTATCVFVAHGSVGTLRRIYPQPPQALESLLDSGLDIARSLWDYRSFLLHIDMEYVNFDYPAEPYLHRHRIFEIQEPVLAALKTIIHSYGIEPLHLLSGRGHHLIWRIDRESRAFDDLRRFGRVSPEMERYYAGSPVLNGACIEPPLGKAYSGLGMVLEYLTDTVIKEAGPLCAIPVTFTDIEVEPQQHGRETVSIDVSEYSDPLNTRMIRIAFSIYSKAVHLNQTDESLLPLFFVPCDGLSIDQGISIIQSPEAACDLAEKVSTVIPDYSHETCGLIAAYAASPLARFHDYFYSIEQETPARWPETYDRADLDDIPCCIRALIEYPDKKLLRPAAMQLVVRALYAKGWHPQHIAGLIRSKFERDYDWGGEWIFYNPIARADFYIRALSGAIAIGTDTLDDFNCVSIKGKGYCTRECDHGHINQLREAARARVEQVFP